MRGRSTIDSLIDTTTHPIDDADYVATCASRLGTDGALVLAGFVRPHVIAEIVAEATPGEPEAFYAGSTHNVYLTEPDPALAPTHPFNRQVVSSKGLIADDRIEATSALRSIYDDSTFRAFLSGVLGIEAVHSYADDLSSINVHFAADGMELGWHFDNSSFAVTMLLRAPDAGAHFEFVPSVRDDDRTDAEFERVRSVLDGEAAIERLDFEPGDLVLFRGRHALHRVTPTIGGTTRMLVVFAYNDEPGVALSSSARSTFYGR